MRHGTQAIGLVLSVILAACGGAVSPPPATAASSQPGSDNIMVETGGCRETPVNDEVKRVDAANLPWAYVVVNAGHVDCQERRVVIQAVEGLAVIIASFHDDAAGTNIHQIGPAMLSAAVGDFQSVDPAAKLSGEHAVKLGEEQRDGHCGRIDFTKEGQALVTHVCAAWGQTPNSQSHVVMVMYTNTEAANVESGIDVMSVMGNMTDALVLNPQPAN